MRRNLGDVTSRPPPCQCSTEPHGPGVCESVQQDPRVRLGPFCLQHKKFGKRAAWSEQPGPWACKSQHSTAGAELGCLASRPARVKMSAGHHVRRRWTSDGRYTAHSPDARQGHGCSRGFAGAGHIPKLEHGRSSFGCRSLPIPHLSSGCRQQHHNATTEQDLQNSTAPCLVACSAAAWGDTELG